MHRRKFDEGSAVYESGDLVRLSFLHGGVPHSVTCRWVGKTRLKAKLTGKLDTPCKVAYKVHPISRIRREEKRTFLRYLVVANGAQKAGSTPYISFDTHISKTAREALVHDGPTQILDLGCAEFSRASQSRVCAATVINQLRAYMLIRLPEERKIQVQKSPRSATLAGRVRNLYHRDQRSRAVVALLDFEGNSAADVLRITTPVTEDSRATGRALFSPGDRALVSFDHGGKHYQMETEVMETGLDAVCIRPTSQIHGEAGQQVSVIDFSAGGALLQGSRKLTEFLLDRKVDRDELSSDNPAHRDIFRSLERRLVKLTFQPKLHFPEIGRRFQPRVSAKIRVLAKIVRSQFVACKGKEVVQHGVRFVCDEQDDEGMDCWREIKKGHGNRHFNEIHTTLGRLSGFLERESRDKGLLGVTQEISGNRVAFAVEKATASGRKRRVIS